MRKTRPHKGGRHYEIIFRSTAKQEVISVARTKLLWDYSPLWRAPFGMVAWSIDRRGLKQTGSLSSVNFNRNDESDKSVFSRMCSSFSSSSFSLFRKVPVRALSHLGARWAPLSPSTCVNNRSQWHSCYAIVFLYISSFSSFLLSSSWLFTVWSW